MMFIINVQLMDSFADSNWYRFSLAAKWYKNKFFDYCQKYGLFIPNQSSGSIVRDSKYKTMMVTIIAATKISKDCFLWPTPINF